MKINPPKILNKELICISAILIVIVVLLFELNETNELTIKRGKVIDTFVYQGHKIAVTYNQGLQQVHTVKLKSSFVRFFSFSSKAEYFNDMLYFQLVNNEEVFDAIEI
ncbi:hypothetical protein JYT51_01370 [Candidatus Amoebophilus asiaticus]|nr:hypothetical protein [Candidatus Amoebophilus asiaticus]